MASIHSLNDVLRGVIRQALEITVEGVRSNEIRPAFQRAPTGEEGDPNLPYASLSIYLIDSVGWDSSRLKDNDDVEKTVTETLEGTRKLSVSVNFFKEGAITRASRLKALLQLSSIAAKLQAIGAGFIRASGVRDLSTIDGAGWEERGQIDLEFYIIAKETDILPTFGTFPISLSTEELTNVSEVYEP